MPIRDNNIYCINHPDELLREANDGLTGIFHLSLLAKNIPEGYSTDPGRAIAYRLFSCKICGYSEIYLTEQEKRLLK